MRRRDLRNSNMHDRAMERQSGSQSRPLRGMQRRNNLALPALLLAALFGLFSLSGCQIVVGVLQIAQGFPKNTCDFTAFTKKSLTKDGKKVVVLSSSSSAAQLEEPSLDLNVIGELSRKLKIENIDVVNPHLVSSWIDDNGEITNDTVLEPIGRHFHADYIILITFKEFGYREENSQGLYRGHAEGKVTVSEMVGKDWKTRRAKVIYNKPFTCKYPANQPMSISADEGPEVFKQQFLERLSKTLAFMFYDHRLEDEI